MISKKMLDGWFTSGQKAGKSNRAFFSKLNKKKKKAFSLWNKRNPNDRI